MPVALNRVPYSLNAKCPAQPRAGTIVAAGEVGWRPAVPVAIERYIPRQIAEDLHIIGRVRIEMNAAGFGDGRKQGGGYTPVGFVKPEKLHIRGNHGSCEVLRALRNDGRLIIRALPGEASEHRDARMVSVL